MLVNKHVSCKFASNCDFIHKVIVSWQLINSLLNFLSLNISKDAGVRPIQTFIELLSVHTAYCLDISCYLLNILYEYR